MVGALIVGLVVGAFATDGFRNSSMDLDEAGVWVVNGSRSLAGRLNTQIGQIDSTVRSTSVGDLIQEGRHVAAFTPGRELSVIDPASGEVTTVVPLPANTSVSMGGGSVAIVEEPTGDVWVRPFDQLDGLSLGATEPDGEDDARTSANRSEPTATLSPGSPVVVAHDGAVSGIDTAKGQIIPIGDSEREPTELVVTGPIVQAVALETTVAVLDPATMELQIGDQLVDLSGHGATAVLQSGPARGDVVAVATDSELLTVANDGVVTRIGDAAAGAPVRPVRVGDCTYAAYGAGAAAIAKLVCDDHAEQAPVGRDLGVDDAPVFRVNGNRVALNFPISGVAMALVNGTLLTVDEWPEPPDPTTESTEPDPEPEPGDCDDNGDGAPVAEDDEFRIRAGVATRINVVKNDRASRCAILTVASVGAASIEGVTIALVDGGRSVQVLASLPTANEFTFDYVVSDGTVHDDESTATVTVSVVPFDAANEPPVQGERASLEVRTDTTASLDVLRSFNDPEGDPLAIVGVSASDPNVGIASWTPDGRVQFRSSAPAGASTVLEVSVSDGRDIGIGYIDIATVDAVQLVAEDDLVVVTANVAATVRPLDNDQGVTPEVRIGEATSEHDSVAVSIDRESATLNIVGSIPGSYRVRYTVGSTRPDANGQVATSEAVIRVDVLAASVANEPPVAVRDSIAVAVGRTAVIDVVANDIDPNGDVLAVERVDVAAGGAVAARLVDHRSIVVEVTALSPAPVIITYSVSDGRASSFGQLLVFTLDRAASSPPIVADDRAVVRAGDVVDVDVLANDQDPDGGRLSVSVSAVTEEAFDLVDGVSSPGSVFVRGGLVRFVASETPGVVTVNYLATSEQGRSTSGRLVVQVFPAGTNRVPVPPTIDARTVGDTPAKIQVPRSGVDPDGDSVRIAAASAPSLGEALWDDECGCFTYQAFASTGGVDSFTYTATDSFGGVGQAQVRIVILPRISNSIPSVQPDAVTVRPGRSIRADVLANDRDADGDSLELIGVAAMVAVDTITADRSGSMVRVSATAEGSATFSVSVTDGRSAPVSSALLITADDDAPLLAPVAYDDSERSCTVVASTLTCAVMANDSDPDGHVKDLQVEVVQGIAQVNPAGELVVERSDVRQLIVYRITDADQLSAFAVLEVAPSVADRLVERAVNPPVIEVAVGQAMTVKLADHVVDPEGASVRLAPVPPTLAGGTATPSADGASMDISVGETVGARTSLVVWATDAVADEDTAARSVMFTLPVKVVGRPPVAPHWVPSEVVVSIDGTPVEVDLSPMVEVDDPSQLRFSELALAEELAGVEATLSGSTLRIVATDVAVANKRVVASVTATAGELSSVGSIPLSFVRSSVPPISVRSVSLDVDPGERVTVDMADHVVASAELLPVSVVAVDADRGLGTVSFDGSVITIETAATMVGRSDVAVTLNDALGEPSRQVRTTVTLRARSVPAAPAAPLATANDDGSIRVSWSAPVGGDGTISGYRVRSVEGSISVESSTAATQLRLTAANGLTAGRPYSFTVEAQNPVGWSSPSEPSNEVVVQQRPGASPLPPTLIWEKGLGDGQLRVRWAAAGSSQWPNIGGAIESYRITAVSASHAPAPFIVNSGVTETVISGLRNDVDYTVTIAAKAAGVVELSPESPVSNAAAPLGLPGAPGTPRVVLSQGEHQMLATATWAPTPIDANGRFVTHYAVYVGSPGNTEGMRMGQYPANDLSYFQPISPGAPLRFAVAAVNPAGEGPKSAWSEPATVYSAPGQPPVPTVEATANNHEVKLVFAEPWNGGRPITGYYVEAWPQGGFVQEANPRRWLQYRDGGIVVSELFAANYTFHLRACNLGQDLDWCGGSNGTAVEKVPGPGGIVVQVTTTVSDYYVKLDVTAQSAGDTLLENFKFSVEGRQEGSLFRMYGGQDGRAVGLLGFGCGEVIRGDVWAVGTGGVTSKRVRFEAAGPPCGSTWVRLTWGPVVGTDGSGMCSLYACRQIMVEGSGLPPLTTYSISSCRFEMGHGTGDTSGWLASPPQDVMTDAGGAIAVPVWTGCYSPPIRMGDFMTVTLGETTSNGLDGPW